MHICDSIWHFQSRKSSEGLSEPKFYGDWGMIFLFSSEKIITRYKRVGGGLSVMWQSACLVFKPAVIGGCAAFFGYAPVGRASGSVVAPTRDCSFWLVGWGRGFLSQWLLGMPGFGWCFSFAPGFVGLFGARGSSSSGGLLGLLSPRF